MEQVLSVEITLADAGAGNKQPDGAWVYPDGQGRRGIVEITSPPAPNRPDPVTAGRGGVTMGGERRGEWGMSSWRSVVSANVAAAAVFVLALLWVSRPFEAGTRVNGGDPGQWSTLALVAVLCGLVGGLLEGLALRLVPPGRARTVAALGGYCLAGFVPWLVAGLSTGRGIGESYPIQLGEILPQLCALLIFAATATVVGLLVRGRAGAGPGAGGGSRSAAACEAGAPRPAGLAAPRPHLRAGVHGCPGGRPGAPARSVNGPA
jgi:hypothetical protein